jgi:hypothetical protein
MRPQSAFLENRHYGGNIGLFEGVNQSGRKGREEVVGVRRCQGEPSSNRESPSFNPLIRKKREKLR